MTNGATGLADLRHEYASNSKKHGSCDMNYPPFVDLLALSENLNRTNKHRKLNKILLQAWRAQSCLGDLLQADECCKFLRLKVDEKDEITEPQEQTIIKALQNSAVNLYARATSTSGKLGERGSIQLDTGQLAKEQKEDHEALITLRNQALAHVNLEHKMGARLWHKISLFAVLNCIGHWQLAAAPNETTWNRETLECLERMLPLAIKFMQGKSRTRISAASEALNEAEISEATFRKFLFDPVKVFGSDAVVERLLKSHGKASVRFWVEE